MVSEVQAIPTPRRSEVVVVEAGQGQVVLQEGAEGVSDALELKKMRPQKW